MPTSHWNFQQHQVHPKSPMHLSCQCPWCSVPRAQDLAPLHPIWQAPHRPVLRRACSSTSHPSPLCHRASVTSHGDFSYTRHSFLSRIHWWGLRGLNATVYARLRFVVVYSLSHVWLFVNKIVTFPGALLTSIQVTVTVAGFPVLPPVFLTLCLVPHLPTCSRQRPSGLLPSLSYTPVICC